MSSNGTLPREWDVNGDPLAGVSDSAGDDDLAGLGVRQHPGGDVDCDAADVTAWQHV